MAGKRKIRNNTDPGDATLKSDWKHLVTVAGLFVAVVGTLLLGAVLQVDSQEIVPAFEEAVIIEPTDATMPDAAVAAPSADATPRQPASESPALEPPRHELASLARRAARDLDRLPRTGWMLQIMLACEAETVQRLLGQSGNDEHVHLLPATHDGRSCFRICWGPFDSHDAAADAAAGLPRWIRALPDSPHPKSIADLQP